MRPRIMSARRFWDIHIRQVDASATRVFSRTEEGSYMCRPYIVKLDRTFTYVEFPS